MGDSTDEMENNCAAYLAALGVYQRCCNGCHCEWLDNMSRPLEIEFNGKTYFVCCKVYGAGRRCE